MHLSSLQRTLTARSSSVSSYALHRSYIASPWSLPERSGRRARPAAARARAAGAAGSFPDPLIALLEQQALQQPTVQLPAASTAPDRPQQQANRLAPAAADLLSHITNDDAGAFDEYNNDEEGESSRMQEWGSQEQLQDRELHTAAARAGVGGGQLHPSQMNFEMMYRQLAAWRARFGVCHVPRYCFDAAGLGAWVRWLRKRKVEGQLPQWQLDRWGWEWGLEGVGVRVRVAEGCFDTQW